MFAMHARPHDTAFHRRHDPTVSAAGDNHLNDDNDGWLLFQLFAWTIAPFNKTKLCFSLFNLPPLHQIIHLHFSLFFPLP